MSDFERREPIEPQWHANLILICEKCGKKLDSENNPSAQLKDWLKKQLVNKGHWGKIRVSTSSCLDICPDDAIAIAITGDLEGKKTKAYVLDGVKDRDWLLEKAIKRVNQT